MIKIKAGNRIRITYQEDGKILRPLIKVIYAQNSDIIGIDEKTGYFYATYWEPRSDLSLPCKRKEKMWWLMERHWKRFPEGLSSILRGITQALLSAENVYIPKVEEVQGICQKVHGQLTILETGTEKDLVIFKNDFAQIQQILEKAKKPELKEVKDQISFCILLKDSLGRINVGVLQVRLTTVNRRLLERFQGIFGWMPHYAARRQALINLYRQTQRMIKDIERAISVSLKHRVFQTGETSEIQIKGLTAATQRHSKVLAELGTMQPFVLWAKYCLEDLNQALRLIQQKRFLEAKEFLKKILEAIKLKQIQFEIDQLIEDLESGFIQAQELISFKRFKPIISSLVKRIEKINEAGFKQPVCAQVKTFLQQAINYLPNYKQAKESLKQASALI